MFVSVSVVYLILLISVTDVVSNGLVKEYLLRSAYTGRLLVDLLHATRMNMGKSSVIV